MWNFKVKGHSSNKQYGPYIALQSVTHGGKVLILATKPNGTTTTLGAVGRSFTITASRVSR